MHSEWISFTGLVLMFTLGLRHGLDPDHIACIDGLTWRALNHEQRHAHWIGTLFAIGHGLLVTTIAAGVSQIAHTVSVPDTVISVFNWVPTGLLLFVGCLNLKMLLENRQNFKPSGWKIKLIPHKLRNHTSPWAVVAIGVLFATVFDTATQASAWGYVASTNGGLNAALASGIVFTLGMVITDTLDGRLICYVSRSTNAEMLGNRYRRILGWIIVALSFGVAGYNLLTAVIPQVELDDAAFSLTGAGLMAIMVVLLIWLRYVQRKRTAVMPLSQ